MFETSLVTLPEKQRLLKLLQLRGSKGVFVFELIAPRPDGLGIAQYNRAIKELRDGDFDGIHHNIVNVEAGHFVLDGTKKTEVEIRKTFGVDPEPFQDFEIKEAVEPPSEWTNLRNTLFKEDQKPVVQTFASYALERRRTT